MRKSKKSFRHESLQDTKSISDILQAITRAIAKGKVVFSDEDDKIIMEPEGLLHLKVTASQEDSRQRINVRISWQVEKTGSRKKHVLSIE
jgi:amphi-Trp domain-containing protein